MDIDGCTASKKWAAFRQPKEVSRESRELDCLSLEFEA